MGRKSKLIISIDLPPVINLLEVIQITQSFSLLCRISKPSNRWRRPSCTMLNHQMLWHSSW